MITSFAQLLVESEAKALELIDVYGDYPKRLREHVHEHGCGAPPADLIACGKIWSTASSVHTATWNLRPENRDNFDLETQLLRAVELGEMWKQLQQLIGVAE
jgi:hypothetical protein